MLTIAGAALIAANPGSTVLVVVGVLCIVGALWAFGAWGALSGLLSRTKRSPVVAAAWPANRAGHITAGHDIKAGKDIDADGAIEAGWGIDAGGNIRVGAFSSGLQLVDRLAVALKQGEAIAARLNDVVPDPMAITAAIEWHDKLYKMLIAERRDLAHKLLDETDVVIEIPTIDLSSMNPAHQIVERQVVCVKEIIEQLEADQ